MAAIFLDGSAVDLLRWFSLSSFSSSDKHKLIGFVADDGGDFSGGVFFLMDDDDDDDDEEGVCLGLLLLDLLGRDNDVRILLPLLILRSGDTAVIFKKAFLVPRLYSPVMRRSAAVLTLNPHCRKQSVKSDSVKPISRGTKSRKNSNCSMVPDLAARDVAAPALVVVEFPRPISR